MRPECVSQFGRGAFALIMHINRKNGQTFMVFNGGLSADAAVTYFTKPQSLTTNN